MKSNTASKLVAKIATAREDLKRAKPHSRRKIELELHLKRLLMQQLRFEIRIDRRNAA